MSCLRPSAPPIHPTPAPPGSTPLVTNPKPCKKRRHKMFLCQKNSRWAGLRGTTRGRPASWAAVKAPTCCCTQGPAHPAGRPHAGEPLPARAYTERSRAVGLPPVHHTKHHSVRTPDTGGTWCRGHGIRGVCRTLARLSASNCLLSMVVSSSSLMPSAPTRGSPLHLTQAACARDSPGVAERQSAS